MFLDSLRPLVVMALWTFLAALGMSLVVAL